MLKGPGIESTHEHPFGHAFPPAPPRTGLWRFSVGLLLITLLWDASGLDTTVMSWLADQQGFSLQHQWWLETVLHDAMRHALTALLMVSLACLALAPRIATRWTKRERWATGLGLLLGLYAVNVLKRHSLTSCPWDLSAFGGTASYVSHWNWGLPDGGPGHCFPGGHASAALAFIAWPLPLLTSASAQTRRQGWWLLGGIGLAGGVLGLGQTLRGAHYPSHTLWSALICWTMALLASMACQVRSLRPSRKAI